MEFVLFVASLACILVFVFKERKKSKKEIEDLKIENKNLTRQIDTLNREIIDSNRQLKGFQNYNERLKGEIENLKKYEDIIDIEAYIQGEKNKASIEIQQKRDLWDKEIANQCDAIDKHKNQLIEDGKKLAEEFKQKINTTLEFIKDKEQKALEKADFEAQRILDSAYATHRRKEYLQVLVHSLENKIKGYGDEFLIPNQTILDDLIEEYNHVDAAQHLKKVKEEIKQAVKNSVAADCDYVEESRKNTAIQFITNAFNGKADVYVSRLRYNNVGKLIQSLKDDYLMLNDYGQAFRNVRINPTYLALRVEELKWGALVLEFKEQEKEEQREIREQIKEEEKARREYEKAIKDAEKEEALLRKAYEKARKEFDQASDTQKAQFDEKMKSLMQQLQEAEEKNQRALSMAQQTRAGHVYVISNIGSFGENVLKLGMTRRLDPSERIRELGGASVPFTFDVHAMIYSDDAPGLENQLHKRFSHQRVNKVNYRKEFFEVPLSDVKEYLQEIGVQAHFTLKAEALQYRESIKIKTLPEDEQHELEEHLEQESEQLATVEED